MILFGEYLHADFSTFQNPPSVPFNIDTKADTFRLGVKFKVGHDYVDDIRSGPYRSYK